MVFFHSTYFERSPYYGGYSGCASVRLRRETERRFNCETLFSHGLGHEISQRVYRIHVNVFAVDVRVRGSRAADRTVPPIDQIARPAPRSHGDEINRPRSIDFGFSPAVRFRNVFVLRPPGKKRFPFFARYIVRRRQFTSVAYNIYMPTNKQFG